MTAITTITTITTTLTTVTTTIITVGLKLSCCSETRSMAIHHFAIKQWSQRGHHLLKNNLYGKQQCENVKNDGQRQSQRINTEVISA